MWYNFLSYNFSTPTPHPRIVRSPFGTDDAVAFKSSLLYCGVDFYFKWNIFATLNTLTSHKIILVISASALVDGKHLYSKLVKGTDQRWRVSLTPVPLPFILSDLVHLHYHARTHIHTFAADGDLKVC